MTHTPFLARLVQAAACAVGKLFGVVVIALSLIGVDALAMKGESPLKIESAVILSLAAFGLGMIFKRIWDVLLGKGKP